MAERIIHDSSPVTLVGGGTFDKDAFRQALVHGAKVVAADGGARNVLDAGVMPEAVIGDFDSLDPETRARIPDERLDEIPDQDTTDFEKCLSRLAVPLIIGVGFAGARLDHELAALNALVRFPDKRCLLIGHEMVTFLAPPEISLDIERGSALSLFPLAQVRGWSDGLRWPIAGLKFAPGGRIGTSNIVEGPVTLRFDAPGMLILLPRSDLAHAVETLLETPARWPEG